MGRSTPARRGAVGHWSIASGRRERWTDRLGYLGAALWRRRREGSSCRRNHTVNRHISTLTEQTRPRSGC
jgi:hypothetical protein